MASTKSSLSLEHTAVARALNIPISTRQSVEISNSLRYRTTHYAKAFLEAVILHKKAVPFVRYTQDMGHKPGMAAGRYPQKAARAFLHLIKSVEANATARGLTTTDLKIVKILANKASIPLTGGRQGYATKRTHLEVQVRERGMKKGEKNKEEKGKVKSQSTVVKAEPRVGKVETKPQLQPLPLPSTSSPSQTKSQEGKSPVKMELSARDLLKQAEKKAAQLQQKQKEDKSVQEVSNLYQELKKKGTLRGKGD